MSVSVFEDYEKRLSCEDPGISLVYDDHVINHMAHNSVFTTQEGFRTVVARASNSDNPSWN